MFIPISSILLLKVKVHHDVHSYLSASSTWINFLVSCRLYHWTLNTLVLLWVSFPLTVSIDWNPQHSLNASSFILNVSISFFLLVALDSSSFLPHCLYIWNTTTTTKPTSRSYLVRYSYAFDKIDMDGSWSLTGYNSIVSSILHFLSCQDQKQNQHGLDSLWFFRQSTILLV